MRKSFYKKKLKKTKLKKNKTKKNKNKNKNKMFGGGGEGPVEEKDILYQDNLVCILKPEVKKGIVIWTSYKQPQNKDSLCTTGLKTGKKLQEEGIDFGGSKIHPYIFFRAPYFLNEIDYSNIESEIISSYGSIPLNEKAFIRVDPDKTFVFSSEIRYYFKHPQYSEHVENWINNSKKTLSAYLKIIHENLNIENNINDNQRVWYNLFTSQAVVFSIEDQPPSPFDKEPINFHSEILVSIPHLTPEYFVLCK